MIEEFLSRLDWSDDELTEKLNEKFYGETLGSMAIRLMSMLYRMQKDELKEVVEMTDKLKEAGEKAVAAAKEFWNQDIIDPSSKDHSEKGDRSRKFIDSIIRTGAGLNWTWEEEYKGDGDFAWCGAFVAACWAKSGLKLAIREKDLASTYRIDRFGQGNNDRKYTKCESSEAIKAFGPRPGDIMLVGEKGYGTHITLIERVVVDSDPKEHPLLVTIEGNGFGKGPDETKREGVIRKTRSLSDARRIIRPALTDLV